MSRRCCSRGHIRLRAPYGLPRLQTFIFLSTKSLDPHGPRTDPARAPHGILHYFLCRTGPVRVPYRPRTGAVRLHYGHTRCLIQPRIVKSRTGVRRQSCGARTGPVRPLHGLFTGCSRYQNPYGARKLIMHALKLYGPRTGRKNSYGAVRPPYGPCTVTVR